MEESEYGDDDCRSLLSLSTDSAFDGPYAVERYALFLHYYSTLRLDPEDASGSALSILNAERKRVGIRWTLGDSSDEAEDLTTFDVDMVDETSSENGVERDEGLWGHGGEVSGDTAHCGGEHIEMDIEMELRTVFTREAGPFTSLSDFMEIISPTTPATQTTTIDPSQRERSPSRAYTEQSLLFPPSPLQIADSEGESECHSFTRSELSPCLTDPIGEPAPLEGVERMEGADSTMEDTSTPLQTTDDSCPVRGPSSIYDLEAIMTPSAGEETAHLREKLLKWKQVEWLQLGASTGRPTRRKDTTSERLKEGIARELATIDAELVRFRSHIPYPLCTSSCMPTSSALCLFVTSTSAQSYTGTAIVGVPMDSVRL
jgi:hypothetical protein